MKNKKINKILFFLGTFTIFILYVFPFLLIVLNSFKERTEIVRSPLSLPSEWALDNYIQAFESMNFLSAITNSFTVTVSSLILIILFSSMFAYFLARWNWKVNKFIFTVLVLSMLIPFQVVMIPFVYVFGNIGVLDRIPTLSFAYLGFGVSQATFLYHGFIKGIPKELEEAALVDGASKLKVFFQIVFPILKPITATISIVNVLWIWNDFLLPSLVLISPEVRTIPLSTIAFFGRFSTEFGVAMAALILAVIPVIIFFLLCQKQIIKGLVEGAVK